MPLSRTVRYFLAELRLSRRLRPDEASLARGFFGQLFPDDPAVHQHEGEGTLYRYPRVQFKVVRGRLLIVGLEEGSEAASKLTAPRSIRLHNEELAVKEMTARERDVELGWSDSPLTYRFCTAWLALNQENHHRFVRLSAPTSSAALTDEQQRMLETILVGNVISLAKGLDFVIPGPIAVTGLSLGERSCSLKGVPMLGFLGTFSINFVLPDYVGLGKSVSRGFGCIQRARRGWSP
jgi:hypothetical protein